MEKRRAKTKKPRILLKIRNSSLSLYNKACFECEILNKLLFPIRKKILGVEVLLRF